MDSEFSALNLRSSSINTELVEASANGDIDKVNYCLQNGANANFISKVEDPLNLEDLVYKSTPLMKAAHNGHLQIVIVLLHHLKNSHGGELSTYWTVIVETVRRSAIKRSSPPLFEHCFNLMSHEELQSLTEFSLVSKHFHILKYLIEVGVDINSLFRNGLTPLVVAASTGSIAAMQYLLDHGADVNLLLPSTCKGIDSALISAVKNNHIDAVSLLLNSGITIDSMASTLAFFIVISQGYLDIIKLLICHGVRPVMIRAFDLYRINLIDLDDISRYSDKVSPLYLALYSNQPNVAWHFLSIGFVTSFDVESLSKHDDLRYRLESEDNSSGVLEILNHIKNQPMPLVILCFVNVLKSLSKSKQLMKSIDSLNIPKGMKSRLMFSRINY